MSQQVVIMLFDETGTCRVTMPFEAVQSGSAFLIPIKAAIVVKRIVVALEYNVELKLDNGDTLNVSAMIDNTKYPIVESDASNTGYTIGAISPSGYADIKKMSKKA